jgi:hypothetical protein
VVATYEDADLSGYDKRVVRPDFERMIGDVEAALIRVAARRVLASGCHPRVTSK